jgi:hypothetical protein
MIPCRLPKIDWNLESTKFQAGRHPHMPPNHEPKQIEAKEDLEQMKPPKESKKD